MEAEFMNLPSADGEFTLTDDIIRAFVDRYPMLDVPKELRAINLWLHRNPSRRWSNMLRGIDAWLKKCQPKKQAMHIVKRGGMSEQEIIDLGSKLGISSRAGEGWQQYLRRLLAAQDKQA